MYPALEAMLEADETLPDRLALVVGTTRERIDLLRAGEVPLSDAVATKVAAALGRHPAEVFTLNETTAALGDDAPELTPAQWRQLRAAVYDTQTEAG